MMKNDEWLIRHRNRKCPNHGTEPESSLVMGTFYCPDCKQVWRFRRNQWTWKGFWYYRHAEQKGSKSPA